MAKFRLSRFVSCIGQPDQWANAIQHADQG
jgi:hypothetical protein